MTIRQAQKAAGSLAESFVVESRAKNQHEVCCEFRYIESSDAGGGVGKVGFV